MALASTSVFEVRSDGNANNAGAFNAARAGAGTDYSRQAAAQYAYTDLVIGASNTLTSAARPFSSLDVGNHLRVTGGTGFTAGVYEIVSIAGAVVTLDRSPGTLSSTGGTGNLGGALSGLADAASLVVAGSTVWIREGSGYTSAATITLSRDSSDNLACRYRGYSTTRGDTGMATITSTNAVATSLVSVTGKGSLIQNLKGDGAGFSQRVFNAADVTVTFDGCYALNGTKYGFRAASASAIFRRCLATGNGTSGGDAGFAADTGTATFDRCVSRGNAGNGFSALTAGVAECINCIASGNTLSGFQSNGSESVIRVLDSTAYLNTLDGVRFEAASTLVGTYVKNSIIAANAGYGIRSVITDYDLEMFAPLFERNAFWDNDLGERYQVPDGAEDVTLTADPFTDGANSDFSLNLIEGGGLELRATGAPGEYGLHNLPETSVGYSDIGAVPSGGSTASTTSLGTMRNLFRELTGEKHLGPVPNSVVDTYLQQGLSWFNQVTEYHWNTNDGGIVLVAGTQEYELAASVVRIERVTHNNVKLERGDIRKWDNDEGDEWRTEAAGTPIWWAVYGGNKLVLRPKPSAAAVSAASVLSIFHVSTPPDIGTSGPEQMTSQDWRTVVMYAAHLWSICYPDSALAMQRSEGLLARSREEGQFAQRDAAVKEVRR